MNTTQPGTDEVRTGAHVCFVSVSKRRLLCRNWQRTCCLVNNYPLVGPWTWRAVKSLGRCFFFSEQGTRAILARGGKTRLVTLIVPLSDFSESVQGMDVNTSRSDLWKTVKSNIMSQKSIGKPKMKYHQGNILKVSKIKY